MSLSKFSQESSKKLFAVHVKAYVKSAGWHQIILEKIVSCLAERENQMEVINAVDEIFEEYAHIPYKTIELSQLGIIYWHHIELRRHYLKEELTRIIKTNKFSDPNKTSWNKEMDRMKSYAKFIPDILSKITDLINDDVEVILPKNGSSFWGQAASMEISFFMPEYKRDFLTSLCDYSKANRKPTCKPNDDTVSRDHPLPDYCEMLMRCCNENVHFKRDFMVSEPS